mgnify:CR=1 FL=1
MWEILTNEWFQFALVAASGGGVGAIGMALKSKFLTDFAVLIIKEVGEDVLEKIKEKGEKEKSSIEKAQKKVAKKQVSVSLDKEGKDLKVESTEG